MKIYNSALEIDKSEWAKLVTLSPSASYFQTPACYEFYESLSFLKPFVFAVAEDEVITGLICGYIIGDGNLIKKFFSRRAIIPGGLLLHPEISDKALSQLLETAQSKLSSKSIFIEIRNYSDYSKYKALIESNGFTYQPHLNFHVQSPDVESALKQLNTTKRRDVKLSRKEGADWIDTKNMDDLKDYYKILNDLYKTRIKTPLFPYEFFEKLILNDQGKLLAVKYQNKVIGGSICVTLPHVAVFEWFVCGLDGQVKNVFPSTLATWAGIEFAALNGFKRFDMMGAGKPDEGYGVREFKSKFGGELVEHGRFLCICQPTLYKLGKYIISIIKGTKKKY